VRSICVRASCGMRGRYYLRADNGYAADIESSLAELEELAIPRSRTAPPCVASADLACWNGRRWEAVDCAARLDLVCGDEDTGAWALAILIWAITLVRPMPVARRMPVRPLLAALGTRPSVRVRA